MDPTESRTKRRREIAVADVDLISLLPDDLLILILSLLSTKEVVQTSLLAKGFQNLWAAVPVLDFDFDEFCPDYHILDNLDDEDQKKLWELHAEKFKKFGDGVLKHRDQLINVDSFKLKWVEEETDPDPASAWLDIVAELNLKFLSVHISSEEYDFEVPDSIFSCKSLQEMELNLEHEPIRPISVNLPCLKKLTLRYTVIKDEVMQKLSALPALEEMVLSYCYLYFCHISSGTLKRLVLDGCYNDNETDITISTPRLLYLEVLSWDEGTIKLKKLESLVQACIHYYEDSLFLTALSNASHLELMLSKSGVLEMKDVLKEETTEFPNLKTLKIGEWCMTDEFDVVDRFLSNARNLQKVTLLHRHQVCIYVIYRFAGCSGNKLMILTKTNLSLIQLQHSFKIQLVLTATQFLHCSLESQFCCDFSMLYMFLFIATDSQEIKIIYRLYFLNLHFSVNKFNNK
ncbi:F-box protein At4g22280-like [Carex rostrata]